MMKPKAAKIEYAATASSIICGPYRDAQSCGPTETITTRIAVRVIILCLRLILGNVRSPASEKAGVRITPYPVFAKRKSL